MQNTRVSSGISFQTKTIENFHCFINIVTFFSFSGELELSQKTSAESQSQTPRDDHELTL